MFTDETSKTLNRINKKKVKSAKHELRKQLCNDELLKNYFVLDREKDETSVFRIDDIKSFENEQLIVTKQVSSSPPKISNVSYQNQEPIPLVQSLETIRNDPQLDETSNSLHNHQQLNLFLLQLCCAQLDQGENRNNFQ
ncbi:predicted protein [Naegleria gruberi]|uniref:Predicted protein n=1 Tax=Naegleria gruberi TaxID=5762 RepID=D2VQ18_NAEGR|nr:uncharacterized protein NAEGRDRAFT_71131 [Naegleria gruberi]EFC41099.1 predicted protein [Naegleria gruberi]|eukprot:XP_002673843.1 predicted protein [Naegleria gruberi strain NEG-M]